MPKERDPFHPENLFQQLKVLTNAAGLPLLHDTPETYQVQLRASDQISRGKFKSDPLVPGCYLAHPVTLRALRKDVFLAGEGLEDLQEWVKCTSCQQELDKQFWYFCPYCEAGLPSKRSF